MSSIVAELNADISEPLQKHEEPKVALEETKQNTVEINKANEQKESNDVSKENFSMPELSDIKEEKKEEN